MSYQQSGVSPSINRKWIYGGISAVLFVLIALIGACNYFASFDAPRKGYFAVCQTGGPIQGDSGTCGFKPSGSGRSNIGFQNTLVEFPAQNRFWRASSEDDGSITKGADVKALNLPVSNGGIVSVNYLLTFKLKQDERSAVDLYKKHATRSYGGPMAADDPDEWFVTWLQSQVNPVLERVNREEVSPSSCADLNPSCNLTKLNADLEKLASTNTDELEKAQEDQSQDGRKANQTLVTISQAIEDRLAGPEGELARALDGEFMTDISFEIIKVTPPADLVSEINAANAALATLVKANADARAKVATAKGNADASREEAKGVKELNDAYADSPEKAEIDKWKAICGAEGCPIDTLAGDMSILKSAK